MTDNTGFRGTESCSPERPSLVDTGKGFSVLYQNRYLYSRHDPSRNPAHIVQSLPIRSETLFVCISPLLGYGLQELLEKLPPSCLVLGLECDQNLMAFSSAHLCEKIKTNPLFKYIRTSSSEQALDYIDSLSFMPFRRCVRIDLSGGSALNPDFYARTVSLVDEYISRYWRNHVTLMKLGRNFARNFFRNIPLLGDSYAITARMANRPVFVAGAGPSLDEALPFIREHRSRLCLLAVDTALPSLADARIVPDAIVLVESQFWIERAFAGSRDSRIPVFADLTARNQAIRATGGDVFFFVSEYAKTRYLKRFISKGSSPQVIPPLGSVGLSALYLAGIISKADSPVFFTGLDFSWGRGFTHSRGAPSVREIMRTSARLNPVSPMIASEASQVTKAAGKQGKEVLTDPALSGYAKLCGACFAASATQYIDLGVTGMDTGIAHMSFARAKDLLDGMNPVSDNRSDAIEKRKFLPSSESIEKFLDEERNKLEYLRGILTGTLKEDRNEEETKKTVMTLVGEMDYLFLHFPDSYLGFSDKPDFLKRVRIELEYFLKTIRNPSS